MNEGEWDDPAEVPEWWTTVEGGRVVWGRFSDRPNDEVPVAVVAKDRPLDETLLQRIAGETGAPALITPPIEHASFLQLPKVTARALLEWSVSVVVGVLAFGTLGGLVPAILASLFGDAAPTEQIASVSFGVGTIAGVVLMRRLITRRSRILRAMVLIASGAAIFAWIVVLASGIAIRRDRATFLTASERAWCNTSMEKVYLQADRLGLAPVDRISREAALTPRQEVFTTYSFFQRRDVVDSRTVYDVSGDFLRANDAVGRWPHWYLGRFFGLDQEFRSYKNLLPAGAPLLWYSDRDFPRACTAAYRALRN
ncbi:MAG: hypothetical protein WEB06_14525 [Actinomycetota bacterium]